LKGLRIIGRGALPLSPKWGGKKGEEKFKCKEVIAV
jgi:hypothetical protein